MKFRKIIIFFFINFFLINFFLIKSYASDEKLPLNEEQQNLVNKYHVCEEYSECALETLIKLVEITNSNFQYYEPILANFVEHLVTVGEVHQWKKYEYLWFPDDNITITEEEIMTYLNIVYENEMKISQPSIHKSSKNKSYVHKVLLHNPKQSFRRSHFIENKLVCFERTYVESELLPFLKQNEDYLQSGWGLDIWWSVNNKNNMYIVDKIKIESSEEENTKNNKKGFVEMKHYISKYKLRLKI